MTSLSSKHIQLLASTSVALALTMPSPVLSDAIISGTIQLDGADFSGVQTSLPNASSGHIGNSQGFGSANASLTLDGGTSLTTNHLSIGQGSGATGSLRLDGAGTNYILTGTDAFLSAGRDGGQGTITVQNGASASIFDMQLGRNDGIGTMNITGSGSQVVLSSDLGTFSDPDNAAFGSFLTLGRRGTGASQGFLNITDGGRLEITGGTSGLYGVGMNIGREGTGTVVVSGAGSNLTIRETAAAPADSNAVLQVGRSNQGSLSVLDGGTVTLDPVGGDIFLLVGRKEGSTGTLLIDGQGSSVSGATSINAGVLIGESQNAQASIVVSNGGLLKGDQFFIGSNAVISGNGTMEGAFNLVGGHINPANPAASNPFIGQLTHKGALRVVKGTLHFDIEGTSNGQYDQLAVEGDVLLEGGTVHANFINDFTPAEGDSFDVITSTGMITQSQSLNVTTGSLVGTGLDVAMQGGVLQVVTAEQEQAETIKETTETVTKSTIATVTTSITNRVSAIRFNSPRPATAPSTPQTVPSGSSSGLNGGDSMDADSVYGVWADGTYSSLKNRRAGESFDGSALNILMGVDTFIGSDYLVGAVLGYEKSDIDLSGNPGDLNTEGVSLTGYAAYVLNPNFTAIGQLGYTRGSSELDDFQGTVTVTSDFNSDRIIASASLLYQNYNGPWDYSAQVGYTYAHETFDNYTTSDGTAVSPDNSILGQMRFGGEVAYNTTWGDGQQAIVPFLSGGIVADTKSDGNGDDLAFEYIAGVRLPLTDQLEGGLAISGEELREKEDRMSVNVNVRYSF